MIQMPGKKLISRRCTVRTTLHALIIIIGDLTCKGTDGACGGFSHSGGVIRCIVLLIHLILRVVSRFQFLMRLSLMMFIGHFWDRKMTAPVVGNP